MVRKQWAGAAAACVAVLLAGCGSDATSSDITDSMAKQSKAGTKFMVQLFNSDSGDYWQDRRQEVVFAQATVYCAEGPAQGKADLEGNFDGADSDAIKDLTTAADKVLCPAIEENGGTLPNDGG